MVFCDWLLLLAFFFFFLLPCVACEILVPDQGWNPFPGPWTHGVLTTGPPGNSQHNTFKGYPCSMYQDFIPFYGQITFQCKDIPHFVYWFISWSHVYRKMQLIWKIILISAQSDLIVYSRLLPQKIRKVVLPKMLQRLIRGFELSFIDEKS